MTRRGKNIPPGAPEPKQVMAKINLPARRQRIIKAVSLPSVRRSTRTSPLPKICGTINPKIPEIIKGINNLWNVFKFSNRL